MSIGQNLNNKDDNKNKLNGLEQNIAFLSNNISKSVNPLPDYNIGKQNLPIYSFPKGSRFEIEKNYDIPGPDNYNIESLPNFHDRKLDNLL